MKMKLKNRTKVALISAALICLFLNSFTATATTRIGSVSFPSTVKLGATFEVNVVFDYQYSSDCLYGAYIWLYYGVGVDPVIDYNQRITTPIDNLTDAPKPAIIVIEVDLSTIDCEKNDTFIFRIKWIQGVKHYNEVLKSGEMYSEHYELTISRRAKEASISPVTIIVPLLILSAVVLIRKKRTEI